jgi:hypothetical protein
LITIEASSTDVGTRVTIARRHVTDSPYCGQKGVVIEVWCADTAANAPEEAIVRIGDAVRTTVRRASVPWTRGLKALDRGPRSTIEQRLKELALRRRRNTVALVVPLAVGPLFLPLLVARVTGASTATLHDLRSVALIATLPVVAIGLLLSGVIMPAIELAERTPGRRWVSLFLRSGVITVVAGVATAAVKGKLNLD